MNKRSGIESRQRIMAAACKKFSQCGYSNASIRVIAAAAGISTGGLYLYFKNKQDLYLSLIRELMSEITREYDTILKETDDPQEAIRRFVKLNMRYAKNHRQLIMQTRELGFSVGIEMKRAFFRKQINIIEAFIRKGIAVGLFEPCDVRKTAGVIQGAQRGFIISMLFDEYSRLSPQECSSFILKGLSRRSHRW